MPRRITRERAERIARAHPCDRCKEYTYKKLSVKPAGAPHRAELGVAWQVEAVCGVCGLHQEIGIDDQGNVVYAG